MISMYDITSFIGHTLNDSVEFKEFVQQTIGEELDYLLYTDMADVDNSFKNYVSIATYGNKDETGIELSYETIILVTIARADIAERLAQDRNFFEELTFKNLDAICGMIKPILKEEIALYGINRDTNIKIDSFSKFTPAPMGEEGLQMQIDIKMSKTLDTCSLNKQ